MLSEKVEQERLRNRVSAREFMNSSEEDEHEAFDDSHSMEDDEH